MTVQYNLLWRRPKKTGAGREAIARGEAYIIVPGLIAAKSNSSETVGGAMMSDEGQDKTGWTAAERQALRNLIRIALILLVAIVIAGTIAALLSAALGPV